MTDGLGNTELMHYPTGTVPMDPPSGSTSACFGLESILGGVTIGPDNTNFAFAFQGLHNLAVRRGDGRYFVGEPHQEQSGTGPIRLRDVTCFVSPALNDFICRVPLSVKRVKHGDIIITSDTPFNAMFVEEVREEEGALVGPEICSFNRVDHRPARLAIGDSQLVVKATSILDALGGRHHSGRTHDRDGGIDFELLPLLLSACGSQTYQSGASSPPTAQSGAIWKPLLFQMLAERDADRNDLLPLVLCGDQMAHPLIMMLALRALRSQPDRENGRQTRTESS